MNKYSKIWFVAPDKDKYFIIKLNAKVAAGISR